MLLQDGKLWSCSWPTLLNIEPLALPDNDSDIVDFSPYYDPGASKAHGELIATLHDTTPVATKKEEVTNEAPEQLATP
jgi:hypothetical protein